MFSATYTRMTSFYCLHTFLHTLSFNNLSLSINVFQNVKVPYFNLQIFQYTKKLIEAKVLSYTCTEFTYTYIYAHIHSFPHIYIPYPISALLTPYLHSLPHISTPYPISALLTSYLHSLPHISTPNLISTLLTSYLHSLPHIYTPYPISTLLTLPLDTN